MMTQRRSTYEQARSPRPGAGLLTEFLWAVNITLLAVLLAGLSWVVAFAFWGAP